MASAMNHFVLGRAAEGTCDHGYFAMRTTYSRVVRNLRGEYWAMGSARKEYVYAHTLSSVRHRESRSCVCEGARPAPITVAALDAPGENRSGSAAGRSRVAPAMAERRNLIGAGSELNFD